MRAVISTNQVGGLVLISLIALLVVSCSEGEESKVEISVGEWFIAAPQASISSGDVLLSTTNDGSIVHEIEVFRKDGPFQEFEIGEIEDIGPDETVDLELPLEPGNYELICTIVEKTDSGEIFDHYALGMHTTLTVTD
ncbi:MAG: hypothetical protein H8D69_00535 [Chloroflexi bacterium]|nr:hypothetical protein [Chloroflexota bacterium]